MPVLPRVGERFGRYRIDSQIGRGGMGVVFGATDLSFDRTVALKVVSASLGDSLDFQQRFQREASVLAKLDSPHVIAIFDYGMEEDCPYIATQYVAGGDLGGLIRARGPMPRRLALQVCAQVADALYDAHRAGIVHRDVKPGNVLLRDADAAEPHAYLCDFGIARTAADGLTAPGSVAGTWSYLSPECGRGQPGTPLSDIYALGCLLWVTLTGRPPYTGTDIEVAVAHQEAPVPQVVEDGADSESARLLNVVLARSLAKDPADRFPDADELRTAMLAAAAGSPTSSGITPVPFTGPGSGVARPAGFGETPGIGSPPPVSVPPFSPLPTPPRKRRTALLASIGVVAALVVAGGVVALTQLGGDDGGGTADPGPSPVADGTATTNTTSTPPDPTKPVTNDLDGNGYGDFRMVYHYYVKDADAPDGVKAMYETNVWSSDGKTFTQGKPTTDDGSIPGATPTEQLRSNVRGDFDADGTSDLLQVIGDSRTPSKYRLAGTLSGGTEVDQTLTFPSKWIPVVLAADADADGDADIFVRYYRSDRDFTKPPTPILLVTNNGDGTFSQPKQLASYPTSPDHTAYLLGDFDGDHRADLAELQDLGNTKQFDEKFQLRLLMGTGTGFQETASRTFRGRDGLPGMLAPDLDGDGDDEILIIEDDATVPLVTFDVHPDTRTLTDPVAAGNVPGAYSKGDIPMAFRVTDANGDGKDDVAFITDVNDHHAAIRVAISDGTRLVPTKWAAWDRDFTGPQTGFFDTGSETL